MNTRFLYYIFGSGALVLAIIVFGLKAIEPKPHDPLSKPVSYEVSPLSEVEFESGMIQKKLRDADELRLARYQGDPLKDKFVEIPLSLAIDIYLEDSK